MLYKLYKLAARDCSRFSIVNLHSKIGSFEDGMHTILSHMHYSHSFMKGLQMCHKPSALHIFFSA